MYKIQNILLYIVNEEEKRDNSLDKPIQYLHKACNPINIDHRHYQVFIIQIN